MSLFEPRKSTANPGLPSNPSKTLIIIDTSYIARRAFHTTGDLSYKGFPTGTLYGFLTQLKNYRNLFRKSQNNSYWVFAWDSPFSRRKSLHQAYKKKDELSEIEKIREDEYRKQMAILERDILKPLGFENHLEVNGLEADDIIASLVNRFHSEFKIFIISSDHDLFQLLNGATMYRPHLGKNYGREDFIKEYEMDPSDWAEAQAIMGCDTDDVAGIPGIGIKTVIKYMKGMKLSEKQTESIESERGKRIIERNRILVTLPYKGKNAVALSYYPKPYTIDPYLFLRQLEMLKQKFNFNFTREVW